MWGRVGYRGGEFAREQHDKLIAELIENRSSDSVIGRRGSPDAILTHVTYQNLRYTLDLWCDFKVILFTRLPIFKYTFIWNDLSEFMRECD